MRTLGAVGSKGATYPWLIALGVTAALSLTESWLRPWEQRLTDRWFQAPRSVQIDPRIELVLVDDRSLETLKAPTAFWAPHLARGVAALLGSGARVVGLDWLSYDVDAEIFPALLSGYPELGPALDNPWMPLYQVLPPGSQPRMVQGIYPPNLQSQNTPLPPGGLEQYRPAVELLAMLGKENLGFINLSRDLDGVLRRQSALPLKLQQPLWGSQSYPPFAARIAELAEGEQLSPEKTRFRGKSVPVDRHGSLRITYPSRAGQIPSSSFSDILLWSRTPERLRDRFADKIVLIGPGTNVFQDLVGTPIGEIFGVEAHAYALNTLLTGQYLQEPGWPGRLAAVFLLSSLGVLSGLNLGPMPSLATALTAGLGYWGLSFGLFVRQFWLLPVIAPLFGLGLGWLGGNLLRALEKAREERRIRHLFGRYVSPAVMQVLLKDPAQATLGAVGKRRITVFFSDINGFSTHCEKKSPEAIMEMLNQYFECMNSLIFKHGGTIKQFVGDEIMALYGAPLEHPNPEVAAVQTAVEMVRELTRRHQQDPQEERGFYLIKVGIHSGEVILGNVGSEERTEYAAVGDDVNLGSRIMGLTKGLQADILISQEVYLKVQHLENVEFIPKGAHPVKGRVEPIEIYEVRPR